MFSLITGALVALTVAAAPGRTIEGRFDKTLQVSGAATLDIVTDSGGISVKPGRAGVVEIHAILKSDDRHSDAESRIRALEQNPPVEQSGNTVRIGYARDQNLLRNVSIRFEILTPPESQVRARADSGGIRVEGIQGPAECTADSGGIEAREIGSEVRANADSGGIQIHNVRGGVTARADSGGISAIGIAGAVDVSTDSGGIDVAQTQAAPVHVRADSGGARVKLAASGGYDVRAASDSGRVTVPELTVRGTISPQHIEGKLRGGGPLVDVQVDSGNVTIE